MYYTFKEDCYYAVFRKEIESYCFFVQKVRIDNSSQGLSLPVSEACTLATLSSGVYEKSGTKKLVIGEQGLREIWGSQVYWILKDI